MNTTTEARTSGTIKSGVGDAPGPIPFEKTAYNEF